MKGRGLRFFATYLLLCALVQGSIALAGQISFRSGTLPYEPFSLEHGETVPRQLLGQLAAKGQLNRSIAKQFACMEEIRKQGEVLKRFDYLLGETARKDIEAIRFKGRRRAGFADSFPPAFAWSLLFSETNQTFFAYRYLGESFEGLGLTHTISFRGNFSFNHGADIREWEGVAIVDALTLELLNVEAVPRNYAQVLEVKRAKYLRSFKIGFFGYPIRFRRSPRVQVLEIGFSDHPLESGLSEASEPDAIIARFPRTLVWRDYKINVRGELVRKRIEERRYFDYRFFDTGMRALEYGASVDN